MKIIDKSTGSTVAEILTNHSMSLDEAIELVGEIFRPENPCDEDVEIGGELYWYDALDLVSDDKQAIGRILGQNGVHMIIYYNGADEEMTAEPNELFDMFQAEEVGYIPESIEDARAAACSMWSDPAWKLEMYEYDAE